MAVPAAEEAEALTPFAQRYLGTSGGRLGSTATRRQLYDLARDYVRSRKYTEFEGDGQGPEEYIQGFGPGTKGSTFVDFTARAADGTAVRVQTINTLADRVTPTSQRGQSSGAYQSRIPKRQTSPRSKSQAMKYIFFFATPVDIPPVLRNFESNAPLKFVEMGKRATPNRPIYLESREIPCPGISTHETGNASRTYMVSHRDTKNEMSVFKDDTGAHMWLLSNSDNEETVLLTLAGLWRTGTLLPGSIRTLHNTPAAQQLMHWFLSALKQEHFTKVETWWLGQEALAMLRDGRRLTTAAEQSSSEFNLKMP